MKLIKWCCKLRISPKTIFERYIIYFSLAWSHMLISPKCIFECVFLAGFIFYVSRVKVSTRGKRQYIQIAEVPWRPLALHSPFMSGLYFRNNKKCLIK
jgi:hypothetical protein